MPTLILEHEGRRKAAVLMGRVVIGRRANSHITISDRSVSRIHAWIGQSDGRFFIADSGSRAGTQINGHALRGRKTLEDGDEIKIGPARIKFHSNGALPADAEPLDLSDRPTGSDDGIILDCPCGAPLWAPWDFAGRVGQCRYCGRMVEMPKQEGRVPFHDPSNDTVAAGVVAGATASPARGIHLSVPPAPEHPRRHSIFDTPAAPPDAPAEAVQTSTELLCGACQLPISLLEETHKCPECGVRLHAQCWIENLGCSSYGCKQVGILDPHRDQPKISAPANSDVLAMSAEGAGSLGAVVEWEYLFLPLSLASALLGILSFGVPPVLVGLAVVIRGRRRRQIAHGWMLAASLLVSLVGALAGIAFSCYWWLNASSLLAPFRLS